MPDSAAEELDRLRVFVNPITWRRCPRCWLILTRDGLRFDTEPVVDIPYRTIRAVRCGFLSNTVTIEHENGRIAFSCQEDLRFFTDLTGRVASVISHLRSGRLAPAQVPAWIGGLRPNIVITMAVALGATIVVVWAGWGMSYVRLFAAAVICVLVDRALTRRGIS